MGACSFHGFWEPAVPCSRARTPPNTFLNLNSVRFICSPPPFPSFLALPSPFTLTPSLLGQIGSHFCLFVSGPRSKRGWRSVVSSDQLRQFQPAPSIHPATLDPRGTRKIVENARFCFGAYLTHVEHIYTSRVRHYFRSKAVLETYILTSTPH